MGNVAYLRRLQLWHQLGLWLHSEGKWRERQNNNVRLQPAAAATAAEVFQESSKDGVSFTVLRVQTGHCQRVHASASRS